MRLGKRKRDKTATMKKRIGTTKMMSKQSDNTIGDKNHREDNFHKEHEGQNCNQNLPQTFVIYIYNSDFVNHFANNIISLKRTLQLHLLRLRLLLLKLGRNVVLLYL